MRVTLAGTVLPVMAFPPVESGPVVPAALALPLGEAWPVPEVMLPLESACCEQPAHRQLQSSKAGTSRRTARWLRA